MPARMAASRFPGKPLHPILGRAMIEHAFLRARLYPHWDGLFLCTCDQEIYDFAKSKGWPVLMTSDKHTRALDRVAEAAEVCGMSVQDDDIVINVQGDEPMLQPDMIATCIQPMLDRADVPATILTMPIAEEEIFLNPDAVKLINNSHGEILYTSRAPIPYCKGKFSIEHGAKRIYGIFGFRWKYLKKFTSMEETFLEKVESCDSNRILDADFRQRVAVYPHRKSFSVDSPADIDLVEQHIQADALWGKY